MMLIFFFLISGRYNFVIGHNAAQHLTSGSGNFVMGDYIGNDITTQNCQIRVGTLSHKYAMTEIWRVDIAGLMVTLAGIDDLCHNRKGIDEAITKVKVVD